MEFLRIVTQQGSSLFARVGEAGCSKKDMIHETMRNNTNPMLRFVVISVT